MFDASVADRPRRLITLWAIELSLIFVLRKKRSYTTKGMKAKEIEKGDCVPPTRTVLDQIPQLMCVSGIAALCIGHVSSFNTQ